MKYKWIWILILLAIAAFLAWWWTRPEVVVTNVEVTFTGNCAVSVDPVEAHTGGTVTFTNGTECTISITFGTRSGTQPFEGVTSIVLAPGASETLSIHDDADGSYTTVLDCGACDPGSGSSTPIIKVSPPPPNPEP